MNGLNDAKNQVLLVMLSFMTMLALVVGVSKNAHPASGCIGKITWIYTETDGTQIFTLKPFGNCPCQNTYLGEKGFINPASNIQYAQTYENTLDAILTGKTVTVWYEPAQTSQKDFYCQIRGVSSDLSFNSTVEH